MNRTNIYNLLINIVWLCITIELISSTRDEKIILLYHKTADCAIFL